jgi:HlyD family secretion protein
MKRAHKRLLGAVLLLGAVALLVALLRPAPLPVETALASRGPLQETVEEEGETRVRDRYTVTAPVAGRVGRITLREGDSVARGATVALLYPAPLDVRSREAAGARVSQAEDAQRAAAAAVAAARGVLEQAQRGLTRAQALAKQGLLAPQERERAELEVSSAQRALESADFQAQAAAHDAEVAHAALLGSGSRPIALRSPVEGKVLRIVERSERVVAAGEALLELGDLAKLEIVADLLSSDAVRVQPGDSLLIEGWGGGTLNGCVRRVEPSGFTKVSALGVEEQRVNVVGDFADAPADLGDRFRVELRIIVWESDSVLQVPGSAVFRRAEGWAVFVIDAGRARLRDVEVGHRTPFVVEVTRGVKEGEVVIRDPSDRIGAGSRVRRVS